MSVIDNAEEKKFLVRCSYIEIYNATGQLVSTQAISNNTVNTFDVEIAPEYKPATIFSSPHN